MIFPHFVLSCFLQRVKGYQKWDKSHLQGLVIAYSGIFLCRKPKLFSYRHVDPELPQTSLSSCTCSDLNIIVLIPSPQRHKTVITLFHFLLDLYNFASSNLD